MWPMDLTQPHWMKFWKIVFSDVFYLISLWKFNTPEIKNSGLQSLMENGKIKIFKTDDEGRIVLNRYDPDDLEWLED